MDLFSLVLVTNFGVVEKLLISDIYFIGVYEGAIT